MRPMEYLRQAENFVERHGNIAIFYKNYTDARQDYDVVTSIEVAVNKQGLLEDFTAETENLEKSSI